MAPIYQTKNRLRPAGSIPGPDQRVAQAQAQVNNTLSQQAAALSTTLQTEGSRNEQIRARKEMSDLQMRYTKRIAEDQINGVGGPGYSDRLNEEMRADLDGLRGRFSSEEALNYIDAHGIAAQESFYTKSTTVEVGAIASQRMADIDAAIDNYAELSFQDPETAGDNLQATIDLINASGMQGEAAQKKIAAAQKRYTMSALDRTMEVDVGAAAKRLESGDLISVLGEREYLAYREKIKTKMSQENARARADFYAKGGVGAPPVPFSTEYQRKFDVDLEDLPGYAPPPTYSGPQAAIQSGIQEAADALGVSAIDLATVISYETAGTFDPAKRGPTTKWGQHRGLIQFGEPQAREYGVDWNDPVGSQLGANGAIVRYLKAAGVKPGMGIMDIYSAINAGGVGRYGASDAHAGGAPGTVAQKVRYQMGGHRRKAEKLMAKGGDRQLIQPASGKAAPKLDPDRYKLHASGEYYMDRETGEPVTMEEAARLSVDAAPKTVSKVAGSLQEEPEPIDYTPIEPADPEGRWTRAEMEADILSDPRIDEEARSISLSNLRDSYAAFDSRFKADQPKHEERKAKIGDGHAIDYVFDYEEAKEKYGWEKAEQLQYEYDLAKDVGAFTNKLKRGTVYGALEQVLEAEARVNEDSDNYIADRAAATAMRQAYDRMMPKLLADPAGYILPGDQRLQSLRKAWLEDRSGAALREYMFANIAYLRSLGLREEDIQPISNADAINLGKSLETLARTDPQNLAAELEKMSAGLGYSSAASSGDTFDVADDQDQAFSLWGRVTGQMHELKALRGDMMQLVRFAGHQPTLRFMLDGYAKSDEEGKRGMADAEGQKFMEIKDKLEAKYGDYFAALYAGSDARDAVGLVNDEIDMASRAAATWMLRNRSTDTDAAAEHAWQMMGQHVSVVDSSDVIAYVPTETTPDGRVVPVIDPDLVEIAAERGLDNLRASGWTPFSFGGRQSPNDDVEREIILRQYEAAGAKFVTNDARDGIVLAVPLAGFYEIPVDMRGQPYEIKFSEMEGYVNETPASTPRTMREGVTFR